MDGSPKAEKAQRTCMFRLRFYPYVVQIHYITLNRACFILCPEWPKNSGF